MYRAKQLWLRQLTDYCARTRIAQEIQNLNEKSVLIYSLMESVNI